MTPNIDKPFSTAIILAVALLGAAFLRATAGTGSRAVRDGWVLATASVLCLIAAVG